MTRVVYDYHLVNVIMSQSQSHWAAYTVVKILKHNLTENPVLAKYKLR